MVNQKATQIYEERRKKADARAKLAQYNDDLTAKLSEIKRLLGFELELLGSMGDGHVVCLMFGIDGMVFCLDFHSQSSPKLHLVMPIGGHTEVRRILLDFYQKDSIDITNITKSFQVELVTRLALNALDLKEVDDCYSGCKPLVFTDVGRRRLIEKWKQFELFHEA